MLRCMSLKSYGLFALLAISVALNAGCSDDDGGPTAPGTGDTTPPTVSSVTARDQTSFEVLFSEAVDRTTAENTSNYQVTRQGVVPKLAISPGDTLQVLRAALLIDGQTVLLSVNPDMVGGETYDVRVQRVQDTSGNEMSGESTTSVAGSGNPDTTVPTITSRDPAANQFGVGVGQSVQVSFSEPMEGGSVESGFLLSGPGGPVAVSAEQVGVASYSFQPAELLAMNTTYTAQFMPGTARDLSGNFLTGVSWDFTTSNVTDTTPPTLVSTTPADEATDVDVNVVFRLEFSEPINPYLVDDDGIIVTPDVGNGTVTWVDGGRTLTFEPDNPLMDNTSYSVVITAGAVRDLAGNPLQGNYSVTFTTASALPTGAITGILSGDSRSAAASDPEGALVAAFLEDFLGWNGDQGPPPIGGVALVPAGGEYTIRHLSDATYWPIAFLDADGDGEISPEKGDAVGVFGVDFTNPVEPIATPVDISGGFTVAGINFPLYDLMGIWGEVSYGGSAHSENLEQFQFYVGLFDTTGFDPDNIGTPVLSSDGQSIVYNREFVFNEFGEGLTAGTYYVGAYMNVNPGDGPGYQPAIDPIGFYRMDSEIAPVTVENGSDAAGIQIVMQDPLGGPPRGQSTGSWAGKRTVESAFVAKLWEAARAIERAAE